MINDDNFLCPYCGDEQFDSWEWQDSGESKCEECGEEFFFEKDFSVTYNTEKM